MATTTGTIKRRYVMTGVNDPSIQVSKDRYNDSLILAGGTDGDVLVRDSAKTDGWGWQTVLPVANGGTGLASVGAAGTVLVGGGATPAYSASPSLTSVSVGNGTAGAPSYTFTSQGTIGMYRYGANALGLAAIDYITVVLAGNDQVYFTPTEWTFASDNAIAIGRVGTFRPASISLGTAVFNSGYYEGREMTPPSAGAVNTGRLYFDDNGSGKTRLMCLFNTGVAQQIAIQP